MMETRKNEVSKLLKQTGKFPLTGLEILDLGCGRGDWLADFCEWGAEEKKLHGIEILPDRLEEAVKRFPTADLRLGSGSDLPWPSGFFDIILQSTVFSSILDPKLKEYLAEEMFRVLKSGGFVLWYDFIVNNPWNLHVRGIKVTEIKNMFPGAEFNFKKTTLAPPITRALAGFSQGLCGFLQNAGFLNTHLLAVIGKNK